MRYVNSLNQALAEALCSPDVLLIGEDICDPYGGAFKVTKGLSSKFPTQVLNTPISEAAIVGFSAGLALTGIRPVVEIMFGDFITLAFDQIITNISKLPWISNNRVSLPLVIRTPMGGKAGYGPTHSQSLEKLFLGVPLLKIVAPSVLHDAGVLLSSALQDEEPVLFIENKSDYARELLDEKVLQDRGFSFESCQDSPYYTARLSLTNFQDDKCTLITYGGSVSLCLEAVEAFFIEHEIGCEVVAASQLKPFPMEELLSSLARTRRLIVVEEGTLSCGWGAELLSRVFEKDMSLLEKEPARLAGDDVPICNSKLFEAKQLPNKEKLIQAMKKVLL